MPIKKIIAFGSAKGGVGKSSITASLALSLSKHKKIGILDADVYGPNQNILFKLDTKNEIVDKQIIPITKKGIKIISMGNIMNYDDAAIWRGPMLSGAIKKLVHDTKWGELDYLLIDMPPGTGDTQLTFSQEIKMDGAIIVSTPQEVALLDVKRGIKMFDKLGVKILGLVDNMSFFIGDDGKKYKIFGEGGVKKTAEEFQKEFLGEIPINPEVGKTGDEGKPIVEANPEHEISKIYFNFAEKIKSTYL